MSRSSRLESGFQDHVRSRLMNTFIDCMIFKMDYPQGIPDLLILCSDRWATLECKQFKNAKRQPNQIYYVDKQNSMGFSRFIYPENEDEIFEELIDYFG